MVASGSDSTNARGTKTNGKVFMSVTQSFRGLEETLSALLETSIIFELNRNECHKMPDALN